MEFALAQDVSSFGWNWDKEKYIAQIKYDGARHFIIKDSKGWILYSRSSKVDVKAKYPHLWYDIDQLPNGVYDCEVYANDGHYQYGNLYYINSLNGKINAQIVIFDVLSFRGCDVANMSYEERHKVLIEDINLLPNSRIHIIENYSCEEAHNISEQYDAEGIIIRERKSPYIRGRSYALRKWKRKKEDVFTVYAVDLSKSRAVLELKDKFGLPVGRVAVCSGEDELKITEIIKKDGYVPITQNAKVPVNIQAEVQYEQRLKNGLRTPVLKRIL